MTDVPNPYEGYRNPDTLILRDWLALDRTKLANERTALAYVRTFIGMEGAALALIKLFDVPGMRPLAWRILTRPFIWRFTGHIERRYYLVKRKSQGWPSLQRVCSRVKVTPGIEP